MKLRQYLAMLKNLVVEDKKILDDEVITSADDEGNGFVQVIYPPSVGVFHTDNGEFRAAEGKLDPHEVKAVCLN